MKLIMENWRKYMNEQVNRKPKAAVLFDGAGFARLGLEQSGWECVGFELNPVAHWLSTHVGSGNSVMADVRDVDLSDFTAVWASPPCQKLSPAKKGSGQIVTGKYKDDLLKWSLDITKVWPNIKVLWVENVITREPGEDDWGTKYNAAQFAEEPKQKRQRIVGGTFPEPETYREYDTRYYELGDSVCPAITATESKWYAACDRRANRWFYKHFGRKGYYWEFADKMGMEEIPQAWKDIFLDIDEANQFRGKEKSRALLAIETKIGWDRNEITNIKQVKEKGKRPKKVGVLTACKWRDALIRAIGNGVVVSMARKFGEAALKDLNK